MLMYEKNYPTIKNTIFASLALLGLFLISGIIFSIFESSIGENISKEGRDVALLVFEILPFVIMFKYLKKKSKTPVKQFFNFSRLKSLSYLFFIIAMIGVVIISSEFDNILHFFFPVPKIVHELFGELLLKKSFLISIFSVAVFPSLFEEIIFRGYILKGLVKNYSVKKSILISSLLFSLIHLNPWQIPSAFIMGIIFSWIAVKSGSIILPVIGHFLNNFIYLCAVRFSDTFSIKGFNTNFKLPVEFQPLLMNLAGLTAICIGFYLLNIELKKSSKQTETHLENLEENEVEV